jgi:hypothetical protein
MEEERRNIPRDGDVGVVSRLIQNGQLIGHFLGCSFKYLCNPKVT